MSHMPSWLRSECTEKNKLSMRFKNGSNIRASSSVDASRSSSLSLLIVDECAFITNMEDIWTASQSTITTKVVLFYYQLQMVSVTFSTKLGLGLWMDQMTLIQ